MTNRDIITIAPAIMTATAHCLPVEHWYKWHKFRRVVGKAYDEIGKEQDAMLADCGIERGQINGDIEPEKAKRWNALNATLLARDADVTLPARIPLRWFKELYDENRSDHRDIFANAEVEAIIIDNLFIEEGECDGK